MNKDKYRNNNIQDFYLKPEHIEILYKLLEFVTRLLDKHDIQYWIDGGTLLGAVRHMGQIPWDDDLDLGVFNNDFQRIRKLKTVVEDAGYVFVYDPNLIKIRPKEFNIKYDNRDVGHPTLDIFRYKSKNGIIKLANPGIYLKWPKAIHKKNDFLPFKLYKYGELYVKGVNNPYPYIDGSYPDWMNEIVIEVRDLEDIRIKNTITYQRANNI